MGGREVEARRKLLGAGGTIAEGHDTPQAGRGGRPVDFFHEEG